MPTGIKALIAAIAASARTIGPGRRHQVRARSCLRSPGAALAANEKADRAANTPATTAVVGPSRTFSKPMTATHPSALSHSADSHGMGNVRILSHGTDSVCDR